MDNGEKYKQLFIWGSVAYWLLLRLVYLHTSVNGYYLFGELIWGFVVGRLIKKSELDDEIKKQLYEKLCEIGGFILFLVTLIFMLYERSILHLPHDSGPYDWEARFRI